jgi:hypothetical protein
VPAACPGYHGTDQDVVERDDHELLLLAARLSHRKHCFRDVLARSAGKQKFGAGLIHQVRDGQVMHVDFTGSHSATS